MSEENQTIELSGEFSDAELMAICEAADVIGCECPGYLVRLLNEVRQFRHYTYECRDRFPEDVETHEWLNTKASQVEMMLSLIIVEFLQKENLLDDSNHLNLQKLAERSRNIALNKKLIS